MPIDPWIPLAGKPFDPSSGLTLGLMGQRYRAGNLDIQQAAAENQRQNQLRTLLGNMTPQGQGGQYAPNQLQQMMALDPKFGIGLGQQQQEALRQQQLMEHYRIEDQARLADLANPKPEEIEQMTESQVPAMKAYLDYRKSHPNASVEEATAVAQKVFDDSHGDLEKSGLVRPSIFNRYPAKFDPVRAEAGIRKHSPNQAAAMFPLTEAERAEKKLDEPSSDIGKLERDVKKGLITQKQADAEIARKTAMPVSIINAGYNKEIEANSGLLGALTELGVPLPQGYGGAAQRAAILKGLHDRNPGLSDTEIAQKVAKNELQLASTKKEVQTIAAQTGKTRISEEEIPIFGAKLIAASKKIPRGDFIPFNQMVMMKDEQFSNKDLIPLKGYMQTMNNIYDVLAGRGGTDVEKREHARKLFNEATSQEGIQALVSWMNDEAKGALKGAGRARESAMSRFSLDAGGGGGGGGGGGSDKEDPLGIR
jgi:hypothetical protein